MLCLTAGALLEALNQYALGVFSAAKKIMASGSTDEGQGRTHQITRLDMHAFGLQPGISIEYSIMERASNVTLVPAKFASSNVGAWPAVATAHVADANGNTLAAAEHIDWVAVDTTNTHVHIETQGQKRMVSTVGIHNAIVVHTPDAVLLADKARSQDVKMVVKALTQRNIDIYHHQSTIMPSTVSRPWATYTILKEEDGYKVKRITVRPGQNLSFLHHHHRAEHWMIVRGPTHCAGGRRGIPNRSWRAPLHPLGEKHRLNNKGEEELVLIEVQIGVFFG
jgi:mannose-1-phosphate guanylyltransferase / mannose-6-phosphate isomerase